MSATAGALRDFGAALLGLTTRGRSFLAAGSACLAAAVLVGQRDLLRVGILLFALPLACAWVVIRTRYRLACHRWLEPARVAVGQEATVALELDNVSRLPTGLLLVEDRVPYALGFRDAALGHRTRFVLDRVESRGRRVVNYVVRSQTRGRFGLGPLSIRLTDPFGMCELQRSFAAHDTLVVTPKVQQLPRVPLGGEWTGSGESRARSLSTAGEDDAAPREYRHGDPLHRVHWRSTARYGELMVRREEQPWQSRGTILLDTRARAHSGAGPDSSFEWAVSAAASIGLGLAAQGFTIRLLTDTGASVASGAHDADGVGADFEGQLLDALAVIEPSTGESLRHLRASLRGQGAEGLLVAVLGAVDVEQAAELARLRHGSAPAVAVLLDVAAWNPATSARTARRVGVVRPRTSQVSELDRVTSLLTSSGWRVLVAGADADLPALWPRAGLRDLPTPQATGPHRPAGAGESTAATPSRVRAAL